MVCVTKRAVLGFFGFLLLQTASAVAGCGPALKARAIPPYPKFVHAAGAEFQTGSVIVSGGLDLVLPVAATHLGIPRLPHKAYRDQHLIAAQIPDFHAIGSWRARDRQAAAEDAVTAREGTEFAGKTLIDLGAGMSDLVPYLNEVVHAGKSPPLATGVDFWYGPDDAIPDGFNRLPMETYRRNHFPKGCLRRGDVLDLATLSPSGATYDYVTSHMLWSEFAPAGRERMLRNGWRLLAPGGELRFASDVIQVTKSGDLSAVASAIEAVFDDESRKSGGAWGGAVLHMETVHRFRTPGRLVSDGLLPRLEDYRLLSYAFPDGQFLDIKNRLNPRDGIANTYEYVSDYHVILIVVRKER
jgi:hypothetical protein